MRSKIFYSFLFLILLVIALAIVYVFYNRESKTSGGVTVLPTPTPFTKQITPALQTNPPVVYEEKGGKKLLEELKDRIALSQNDKTIRAALITSLANNSGVLKTTSLYNISYVKSMDIFEVELLTENISQAKQEATVWFLAQGLSNEGICHLPIVFFLNWDIAQQLRDKKIIFNPMASGC